MPSGSHGGSGGSHGGGGRSSYGGGGHWGGSSSSSRPFVPKTFIFFGRPYTASTKATRRESFISVAIILLLMFTLCAASILPLRMEIYLKLKKTKLIISK